MRLFKRSASVFYSRTFWSQSRQLAYLCILVTACLAFLQKFQGDPATTTVKKDSGMNSSSQKDVGGDSDKQESIEAPPDPILADVLRFKNLSQSVRQFLTKPVINPHDYGFLLSPSEICDDPSLLLLFIVPSGYANRERRQKLRKSRLATYVANPATKSKILFFIGKNATAPDQNLVNIAESQEFGDIVLIDFVDSYEDIRLKTVSMLKWVSTYCRNVPYVIRNDDDIDHENYDLPVDTLKNMKLQNFILGGPLGNWMLQPVRDKSKKYYMPRDQFSEERYPLFARGAFLGFPGITVKLLYEAALRTPVIWLDDVYFTGICARHIQAPLITDTVMNFKHEGIPVPITARPKLKKQKLEGNLVNK